MGDGTRFDIDVVAKADSAIAAAAAVSRLEGELRAAGDASTASAAAVAAGEAKYKQLEVAASRAASTAERLGATLDAHQAKMQAAMDAGNDGAFWRLAPKMVELEGKQRAAAAAAQAAASALKGEAASLDAAKSAANAADAAHVKLGQDIKAAGVAAKDAAKALDVAKEAEQKAVTAARGSGSIDTFGRSFKKLGGPVGQAADTVGDFVESAEELSGALGGAGGLLAISAVLFVAIAAAAAAATIAIVKWAVGLADANRSAALNVEALEASSEALRGLSGILPGVSGATGLASDKVADLAKQLASAGVSAADMPDALRAAAMQAAALGQADVGKLAADLKAGKKSAAQLRKEMEKTFGGVVKKKLLGIDAQAAALKKNLAATFGGLDIEPLLAGAAKLVGLLDANTATGRALKLIFEGVFQPLIDGAVAAIPVIERLFIGATILALKAYIALKPYGEEIAFVAKVFAVLAAIVVGVVVGSIALFVGFIAGAVAIIGLAIAAVVALGAVIIGALGGAIDWLTSLDFASIATGLIDGLVGGIVSGTGIVVDAIRGLGSSAMSALKGVLGIASPSKVFEGFGINTAEGFAGGVDDGAGAAQSALASMVEPPDAPGAKGAGGGAVSFTININAPSGDAKSIGAEVHQAVADLVAQWGLELGAT